MKNHYHTLGLEEGASQEEIQEAYDRLSKELDPRNNDNQEFFTEEFEKLQAAYKVLRNSSILSVTSENVEESTLSTSSSAIKKPIRKLKPQKSNSQSKVKTTKLIIVVSAIIISGIFAYEVLQPKQYELSQIALTNDDVMSAFTRADMKPLNGIVKGEGKFVNGLAEGEHNKLDKNGNSITEVHYKKGIKEGVWKEWYSIKDGKWHFWYEKGLPKKEYNYSNGKLEGEFRSWFANGQLKQKGTFKKGLVKGEWSYYDNNGKLLAHFNYDGKIWADKNLDVSRYRNGDLIPEVKDPTEWNGLTTGAWCYYDNDPKNGAIYGKLYNWYAVNDPRGLAPAGYHIPSDFEWSLVINHLGGPLVAGGKMKETGIDYWGSPNERATNESGFTGLPGGYRIDIGLFYSISTNGVWWSSSEIVTASALFRSLYYDEGDASRDAIFKGYGFSVRCLRD